MKKIIALIVLVGVMLVGSPWVSGKIVHHRLETLVKNMNEVSLENGAQFVLNDYHQGWFRSTARIRMKVMSPVMRMLAEHIGSSVDDIDSVLVGQVTIDHGPIIWGGDKPVQFLLAKVKGGIFFHSVLVKAVLPEFDQKGSLLTLDTDLHYFDRVDIAFDSPGFTVNHNKSQIRWGGLSGHIHTSSRNDVVKSDASIKPFSFVDPSTDLKIGGLRETVDIHKTHWGFWVGQAHVTMPVMTVQNKEHAFDWTAKQFKINIDTSSENDSVGQVFHMSLDELDVDGESYAPVNFVFLMKNLNAPAVGDLHEFLRTHPPESLAVMSKAAAQMIPLFLNIIHKDTTVGVDKLDVTVPQGKIHFSIKAFWPDDKTYKTPMGALMAMHSHATLEVPVAFVDDMMAKTDAKLAKDTPSVPVAQQVSSDESGVLETPVQKAVLPSDPARDSLLNWQKKGYVIKEGHVYKSTLEGLGMSVKINGKSFPAR